MFGKRYRITLLFNANKAYDRQVVAGVGEYLQASQCDWDIYIEEDFRIRLENLHNALGDGVIADFDDPEIVRQLRSASVPVIAVGGSYHRPEDYPPLDYIATDNQALVGEALAHLKSKGINRFAFYGLPASSPHAWAREREHAFRCQVNQEKYPGLVYQGEETLSTNWQYAQNRLADWLQSLPPHTGIIAATDARARHLLQACEHLNIAVPESLSVIGIDNEEMTRYLSRVALSSVVQGTRQMGYQAAKLLHQRLDGKKSAAPARILVQPVGVEARLSTDYRSLRDPSVIQAMHFIRHHACKGIKVEQVLDAVGLSRSNLEKRFKDATGNSIHHAIHHEKIGRARTLLAESTLVISEISAMCGYPSLQYFYSVFKKTDGMTPKEYRECHGNQQAGDGDGIGDKELLSSDVDD
ncbi:XylR family transcriptional regulator [Salmonella enterica subsp. enterica serovar Choleraesuis]|nr:XylR family transcriptional regulator [Salmonella enterica subsp. enterica serovar Choleraesuis]